VGRAVWKEATGMPTAERQDFLTGVAAQRMARVTALCNALARPWTQLFAPPCVDSNWYTTY
jgi:tagatose 1,6-diphosphate aldolase